MSTAAESQSRRIDQPHCLLRVFPVSVRENVPLLFFQRMDVAGLLDRFYFTDLGERSIYLQPPSPFLLILLMFSLFLRRLMHSLIYHC